MKNQNETKVVCPNCGAELSISVDSCSCKSSSPVVPPSPKKNKAVLRLEALKKAGRSTEGFFAMTDADGEGMLVRLVNGVPTAVKDDDPVLKGIYINGPIPARELFRRWIPAHMLDALMYESYDGKRKGYTEWLKGHGYEYMFGAILQELKYQSGCYAHGDSANFKASNRFLDKDVVISVVSGDICEMKKYIDALPVHRCRFRKYKRVGGFGKGVFVNELNSKVYSPITKAYEAIEAAKTPHALYEAFKRYCKVRVHLGYGIKQNAEWADAFKGIGAYYTLRDFILFEDCKMSQLKWDQNKRCTVRNFKDRNQSLAYLEECACKYADCGEGYKMLGLLKDFLDYNGIDIKAKRAEWHQQTLARKAEKK